MESSKETIILMVEDEAALANALKSKLSKEGFTVLVAKDGEEGLQLARTKNLAIVLLDIVLPKVGGLEMLAELRKDPKGKDLPVIMFTNMDSLESISRSVELGSNDYLIKSNWTLENIIEKIKEKIGTKGL